jgi:hypothetical protein
MSGGVSESSEVDSMQTMRSTRRLRPMYRRPEIPPLSSFRSSNCITIRRYVGEYGRHTNMARGGGALSGETLGALCDQIVWCGRVAAWHSNSQLPTPISTAHPGSRLPRTDARSSSGGYST